MKRNRKTSERETTMFSLMVTSALMIVVTLYLLINIDSAEEESIQNIMIGSIITLIIALPLFMYSTNVLIKITINKRGERNTIRFTEERRKAYNINVKNEIQKD